MTVSSTTNVVHYMGTGATYAYPVPFCFLAESHVLVTRFFEGAATVLTAGVEYVLEGVGSPEGGTLTLVEPLETGHLLRLERTLPLTQLTSLVTQGPFSPQTLERALDACTMVAQQQQRALDDIHGTATLLSEESAALTARTTAVEGRATAVEGRATYLEARDTFVTGTLTSWEFRFEALEDGALALDARVDALEAAPASFLTGTGSPEGVVSAPVGALYTRTDGGAGSTLYVKESGTGTSAGWVAK